MLEGSFISNQRCTLEEEHFVELLQEDLTGFLRRTKFNRVLVFPPLSSRLRFLIHRVVESYQALASCSIGKEPSRRTVVYFVKASKNRNAQFMTTPREASHLMGKGRGRGRGRRLTREGRSIQLGHNSPIQAETSKDCCNSRDSPTAGRRPAQTLYQPGAFRKLKKNEDNCPEKDSTGAQLSCNLKISNKGRGKIRKPLQKSSVKTVQLSTEKALSSNRDDLLSHVNVGNKKEDCSSYSDIKTDNMVGSSEGTGNQVLPESPKAADIVAMKADRGHISPVEVADSAGTNQQSVTAAIKSDLVSPETETCGLTTNIGTQIDNNVPVDLACARVDPNIGSIDSVDTREKSCGFVCFQEDNCVFADPVSTEVEDNNSIGLTAVVDNSGRSDHTAVKMGGVDFTDPVNVQRGDGSTSHFVVTQVDNCGSKDDVDVRLNDRCSLGSVSPEGDNSRTTDSSRTVVDTAGFTNPVNMMDKSSPSVPVIPQVKNNDFIYPFDISVHSSNSRDSVNVELDIGRSIGSADPGVGNSGSISNGDAKVDCDVHVDECDSQSFSSQVDNCNSNEPFLISIHNSGSRDSVDVQLDNGGSTGFVGPENDGSCSIGHVHVQTNNNNHIDSCNTQIENSSPTDPVTAVANDSDSTDRISIQVDYNRPLDCADTHMREIVDKNSDEEAPLHDCVETAEEKRLSLEDKDSKEMAKEPSLKNDQDYNLTRSLEELDKRESVENNLNDDDRTNRSLLTSRKDDPKVEFKGTAPPDEATDVISSFKEKLKTECDDDSAGKLEEEAAAGSDTEINAKTKPKSKRQCKKEEKAKKKEAKLKKKFRAVPKSDTASAKEDPKGKRQAKDIVHGETDKKCEEKEETKVEEEDEDWETQWDESGECLNSEALAELSEIADMHVADIEIEKPKFDYLSFRPKDIVLDSGVYDHVVEIYDFSSELKTQDLIHALSDFKSQGFEIHWVDDTHALAVFSNHMTAQSAVEECSNPMLKLRSLYDGTQESKLKAKRRVDILQPYKERPQTSKLVANRLVAGALGVRSKMSKEERRLEREKIKAEREKKLNKEKQKKDLWESEDLKN